MRVRCDDDRSPACLDLDLRSPRRHELADERPLRSVAEDVELDREAVGFERDRANAATRPDEREPFVVDDRVGEQLGQLRVDSKPRQAFSSGTRECLRDRVDDRGDPAQLVEEQVVRGFIAPLPG